MFAEKEEVEGWREAGEEERRRDRAWDELSAATAEAKGFGQGGVKGGGN